MHQRASTLSGAIEQEAPLPHTRHASARLLISFAAGVIFAAGLVMSGLTQPLRVIGFLDVKEMFVGAFPGAWDPGFGLAMLGAVVIALLAFGTTPHASIRPWFGSEFLVSRRTRVDGRLVLGAVLFGIGWGLSGYCPGAALASVYTGQIDAALFVLAMLPGMWLARKV